MAAKKKRRPNGKKRPKNGVEMAIEAAGSQANLARLLGCERAVIHHWKLNGVVPALRVLKAERKTGVHRHHLNPAIYPDAPQ